MNLLKNLARTFIVILIASLWLHASEKPVNVQFARPLAMGGAFTAVADDNNLFNYNPAGLVQRTGSEFTLLEIMGGFSEDAREALKFVSDNKDHLTNFEEFSNSDPAGAAALVNEIQKDISKLNPRVFASVDVASYLSGPIGSGFHWGTGALGATDNRFKLDAPLEVPTITYFSNTDVMIPITLAKRWDSLWLFPGKLGLGGTAKFIRRFQVSQINQSVAELDDIETPPVSVGKAFGGDLGLLYQPNERINFGTMVQDVGGTKIKFDAVDAEHGFEAVPEKESVIRPRTNMGLSMVPASLLFLLPTMDRWTFSADINDIFSSEDHVLFQDGFNKVLGENLYTHLHFGAEFRYWFLRFRGGFNQGYPTAGLGIDIPFLKLDYTYFQRENGAFAGDVKETDHVLSLAIKFGTGKTESRERIHNLKESKKQQKVGAPEETPETTPKAEKVAPATATPAATAPAKVEPTKEGTTPDQKPGEVKKDKQEIP